MLNLNFKVTMKKVMFFAAICLFAVVLYGCGGANTPKDVAEKAVKCLKSQDYKGYMKLVYVEDEDKLSSAEVNKKKEQIAVLLEAKASDQLEKKGGIDSYEMGEETIEGDEAKVTVKIKYGDGSEKDTDIKLVKDKAGDWKLDAGK